MTHEQLKVKSKVRAVLGVMKPDWKWAACDANGLWYAYKITLPFPIPSSELWRGYEFMLREFDIPTFPGDWKDSLVRRDE